MNQSTVIKQAPEPFTSGVSCNNVISLSNVRMHQRVVKRHRNNMIKQRVMGFGLLIISIVVWYVVLNPIVFILFSMFYLPMIFSRDYVMNFNEQKGVKHNG